MVMLIQIRKVVAMIGIALQDAPFSLGSGMISMFSRKQSCLVLSTVKVEYVASCSASYEVVCLRNLLSDLFDL